ncbi:hypothetical protein [Streptomyces violascens]|uniref:hypothetical protein n=1 Tax=Streptomyces violascens TaxID=67381 RepID=UPI00167478D1|nr:hypothetical protein [Streptomyces violascens]GGU37641.1 hypothetical protein GCM10010289_68200 [Streptomyces violascens]
MAWQDRIDPDAISKYPQLRRLTRAEGEQYLRERRAAWSRYEREKADVRWAVAANARIRRADGRVLFGRDLRIAEEQRLRRRLKRRYGWSGFPEEHPCRWFERSREFTAELREFARAVVVRWDVDRREMGQRERDHLLMEALDALDWPDRQGGIESVAAFLDRHPAELRPVVDEALWRHDEMLDEESCPRCMGFRDEEAPHRVYIAHYHRLGLFKVGVTTRSSDRRLRTHESAGARIVDTFGTADFQEALILERAVLDAVSSWRTSNPLVAGGGEVWKDDVKLISLSSFVERGLW